MRNPDVLFSLRAPWRGSFVGEITTVSDKFVHEENPVHELSLELSRIVRKNGLNPNHFSIRVGGIGPDEVSQRGSVLAIPKKAQFNSDLFTPEFLSFLKGAKTRPNEALTFRVKAKRVDVWIYYAARQQFSYRSYPSYDLPRSIERNVVFQALNRKARQLRESCHPGPLGIFICDGGCKALQKSTSAFDVTAEKIINRFLEKHEFISFVQAFTTLKTLHMPSGAASVSVKTRIYQGKGFGTLGEEVRRALKELGSRLPEPETTPSSAQINQIKWPGKLGHSFRGRSTIKHNEIRLSARTLLEYLAGRIDHKRFLVEAGLSIGPAGSQAHNIFERWLSDGKLLDEISLERQPEKDDDWLELTMSEPDAAISDFKPPRHRK